MSPKPIEEVLSLLEDINNDIKRIKIDIKYLKEYIRKIEIRQQLNEELENKTQEEYIKHSGWWWS